MDDSNGSAQIVRFGTFEADFRAAELRKNGLRVRLQEQPFRILQLLLERPGQVVTRDELRQRLWPAGVFVAVDQSLNNAVKKLRAALGDPAENPRFIETVARHGYRFIAPVDLARVVPAPVPLRRSLPSVWVAIVSLCVLALVAYVVVHRPARRARLATDRIALAVLPFDNLSGDPSQEYFSDGLTEEMTTQLSTVNPRGLGVLARTSAMRFKHTQKGADEIGKELNVDFLVEGSVRRENQRIRISAQLVRVSDQTHVWARSYERDLREILVLQREVAQDIAAQINVSVNPTASPPRSTVATLDPSAYEAYVKGRYFWNKRSKEDLSKAIAYFQEAIHDEPAYAAAYDGLADCWIALGWYGLVSPKEAFPHADDAARKALAIDESLAAAHTSLAFVRFNYDWNWFEAERGFQRAIAVDPDYPNAHHWYADYLSAMGRHEQAIAESERARRLDPLSPIINAWLGWRHYLARQYDAAVEQYRATLELDPNFAPTHLVLGQAYEQQGRTAEAVAELQRAEQLARGGPLYVAALAHALAGAGRRSEAEQELHRLMAERLHGQYVPPVQIAIMQAGLGRTADVIEWLEKGINERSPGMVWIKDDPRFDPFRHDSRFQDIVRRIGFP
jgi:TolB-like protein/DNA-binding winged helix-turn-helix (wHTH) protein/Tfp pilus assembly protein PilF